MNLAGPSNFRQGLLHHLNSRPLLSTPSPANSLGIPCEMKDIEGRKFGVIVKSGWELSECFSGLRVQDATESLTVIRNATWRRFVVVSAVAVNHQKKIRPASIQSCLMSWRVLWRSMRARSTETVRGDGGAGKAEDTGAMGMVISEDELMSASNFCQDQGR